MYMKKIRQIVLDTETTGINKNGPHYKDHSIIEIGAVEIINRKITNNNFHVYIKPNNSVDVTAFKIHGISDEFLYDKPTFAEIKKEFFNYLNKAELIIHNAKFDVGFINYELNKIKKNNIKIDDICKITDSLDIARKIFPNKRNSIDALCLRLKIDNSERKTHSALLDAKLLAQIFLLMTYKQRSLFFNKKVLENNLKNDFFYKKKYLNKKFFVLKASDKEKQKHEHILDIILKINKKCLWKKI